MNVDLAGFQLHDTEMGYVMEKAEGNPCVVMAFVVVLVGEISGKSVRDDNKAFCKLLNVLMVCVREGRCSSHHLAEAMGSLPRDKRELLDTVVEVLDVWFQKQYDRAHPKEDPLDWYRHSAVQHKGASCHIL